MAFISFEDISVRYALKNNGCHTVFSGLNLTIEEGEFVSVIGETGCGKSTLLRLLLGSEKPTAGRVVVDSKEVTHPSRDRGYVPQKYSLFPDKTVIRNVAFGPIAESFSIPRLFSPAWWKKRACIYKEARETLSRVGLLERDAHKYPDQLSGGMQQRVAIAQSLVMHPQILLMDESFSALDPNTRKGMQRLIRSIWLETGRTVVFVTHNLSEAVSLGNRVLMIAKEPDGSKSRIALDLRIPEEPRQDELEAIMHRLEDADPNHPVENLAEVSR
jgi:NitT/TauT family transport system ATP-binding protein